MREFTSSRQEALAVRRQNQIGDFVATTVRFAENILELGTLNASRDCRRYVEFQRAKQSDFSIKTVEDELVRYGCESKPAELLETYGYVRHCQRRVVSELGDTALQLQDSLRIRRHVKLPTNLNRARTMQNLADIAGYLQCASDLLFTTPAGDHLNAHDISLAVDRRLGHRPRQQLSLR